MPRNPQQRNPGDLHRLLPCASGKMAEHLFEDIFNVTRIDPDGKKFDRGKMAEHLFEDIFNVTRIDPDGKKFDRVNRIEAKSEQLDMYMQLDVATDVYPMHIGDKFTMVLAPTLNLDGTPDTGYYTQAGRKTLADKYDYVMHGKLYKISEDNSNNNDQPKVEIYASFGGLLMLLKGDTSSAANLELDQRLFLLIRKV